MSAITARLTYTDSAGRTRLKAWALPLVVVAIVVPVVGATIVGAATLEASALGLVAGALAVATLVVIAVRARPREPIEVTREPEAGKLVLVLATREIGADDAAEIASRASDASDLRVVVPTPSDRLSRWLSAEDEARREGERMLAHSAGALVAAGLPCSGSLGDHDPAQALEDELRDFAADEVIVFADPETQSRLVAAERRLPLPMTRVVA